MINTATATTPELLAFYNANSGKAAVKRFSDRKTAQRRVEELLTELNKQAHNAFGDAINPVCPNCGAKHDITAGEVKQLRNGDQKLVNEHIAFCHTCSHEWNMNNGRAKKPVAASASRSEAIAASWQKTDVAQRRATRHGVVVTNPRGDKETFKSVREAFVSLNLPLGRHIKFRGELKMAGGKEINGYKFRLAN